MKLTGSYKLKVKKELVWKALNDANLLDADIESILNKFK